MDPFGLYGRTPKEMLAMKVREVNNGRLAMFAVIIMAGLHFFSFEIKAEEVFVIGRFRYIAARAEH